MGDDTSQDQNQAIQETQTPMKSPLTQPSGEQQTSPLSSETPTTQTPPNSSSPEPVTPEPQPTETVTEIPAPSETPPQPEQTPAPPSETQPPISQPVSNIPALHYPFSDNYTVTFAFGAQSDNEEIKKKFQEWGIVGHNGLDFGLSTGNEVYPCDPGKVIQSGNNGDFGTSITIQHSWGQSLYAHLSETKVKKNNGVKINQIIGLSGSSGAAFGEHLHFAIKPNNPDSNNGYLGFIDPAPYLSLPSQKETPEIETPPTKEQKPPEETKPPETTQPTQEQPKPEETQRPSVEEVPPIKYEPEKPVEQTQQPQPTVQPQRHEIPQPSAEEIQKQVDEKLKVELDVRRLKANQARQTKREENLMKIEKLIQEKKQINNDDVRELLHVSQSTATDYLQILVDRGTIKPEGRGKATIYHY
jgi:murein DD-endopeptidase MepM/ murein hydrolase activator NlpD